MCQVPIQEQLHQEQAWQIIFRSEHQDVIDRLRARINTDDKLDRLNKRKEIVEHLLEKMKRAFNQSDLLLKGLRKVNGEVGFTIPAYNLRRAVNILGTKRLMSSIRIA